MMSKDFILNNNPLFYYGGRNSVERYNQAITNRRILHGYTENKYSQIVTSLNDNGFAIIENVFNEQTIRNLNTEFQQCIDKGNITADDEHFTVIKDPLYNSKTSFDIATSDLIFDISSEFFGCTPSLCTQNFRLSKLNQLNEKTTQFFHCDRNSHVKFIKFFIYLNDVDLNGGPLTYVLGSNKRKPANHLSKYRWSHKDVADIYGEESVKYLTASAGDLLIANTTGFHRGTKPISKDRKMLTLNYVIERENGLDRVFPTRKEWVDTLTDQKKPMFDFMVIK